MRGKGVDAGAQSDPETALALDPPLPYRPRETRAETLDEPIAARARVWQALKRNHEHSGVLDLAVQQVAREAPQFPTRREIVRAQIDAALLGRGFRQERNMLAAREQAKRLRAPAAYRRQHNGGDSLQLVADVYV